MLRNASGGQISAVAANPVKSITAGRAAVVVVLGSLLLWASAKAQVPFWPVPMTLQSYVVLMLGALFGQRLGAATVAAYLVEGAVGLPVFAGTPAHGIGLAYMAGPTGGYLAGYLAAAAIVGVICGSTRRSVPRVLAAMILGELAIVGLGCAWLTIFMSWNEALVVGFGPFLVGDAVKIALAVVSVVLAKPLIASNES